MTVGSASKTSASPLVQLHLHHCSRSSQLHFLLTRSSDIWVSFGGWSKIRPDSAKRRLWLYFPQNLLSLNCRVWPKAVVVCSPFRKSGRCQNHRKYFMLLVVDSEIPGIKANVSLILHRTTLLLCDVLFYIHFQTAMSTKAQI